jgi:hypothetical protein
MPVRPPTARSLSQLTQSGGPLHKQQLRIGRLRSTSEMAWLIVSASARRIPASGWVFEGLEPSDSCFDPWINLPASAIKRTVFVFGSSILRRNNEDSSSILRRNSKDSSSCCDLAMPCMRLSSKGWASHAELSDCTKDRRPERRTAEGCVKQGRRSILSGP